MSRPCLQILLSLFFSYFCTAASSLTDIEDWALKAGTLKARIIYLSDDKKTATYAGEDNIIKALALEKFAPAAIKTILEADAKDKRKVIVDPYVTRRRRGTKQDSPKSWPLDPGKGLQIKGWNDARRNSFIGINLSDIDGSYDHKTETFLSAALWWNSSRIYKEEATSIKKLHKKIYRSVSRVVKQMGNYAAVIPFFGDTKNEFVIVSGGELDLFDIHTRVAGSCFNTLDCYFKMGNRIYNAPMLLTQMDEKGNATIYRWGEKFEGQFVKAKPSSKSELKDKDLYVLKLHNPEGLAQWLQDDEIEIYCQAKTIVTVYTPVERQIPGVKWQAHPTTTQIKTKKKEKVKLAEQVVLPDNEIKFLAKPGPLTMQLKSKKGQLMNATLFKFNEGLVTVRKTNAMKSFDINMLDFNSQQKVKFWAANQGAKLKLPACKLHYKIQSKSRYKPHTLTIHYDGKSKLYLTDNRYREEVYFDTATNQYAVYKSEKGQLRLVKSEIRYKGTTLSYPKIGALSDDRKNYPLTTASTTPQGFSSRILISERLAADRFKNIIELKAANVSAQPVLQFFNAFGDINTPATLQMASLYNHFTRSMKMLYINATLPVQMDWKNRAGLKFSLTLDEITPLDENFFDVFDVLENKQKQPGL